MEAFFSKSIKAFHETEDTLLVCDDTFKALKKESVDIEYINAAVAIPRIEILMQVLI